MIDIEVEINKETKRIDTKSAEIENKISTVDKKISTYTNWAWGFVWIGIIVLIFSVIYFFKKNDESGFALNLLGDFLAGTVASLWALAGLFFIYVAFLGQKQQLLNQQLEIMYSQLEVKYTRYELEGQKKELMEQNLTLRKQRFENTFFQLLRNHQDIVTGIDIRKGSGVLISEGRDCFKSFYRSFTNSSNISKEIGYTKKKYMEMYKSHQADLGHYFRNIYHILKFIDGSEEIEDSEKYKYASLLRALLSSYELIVLFYNCLGDYGIKKFKPLIEKYSFLKNIDYSLLVDNSHKNEYLEIAFADSEKRKNFC
ncbi:hypothetical protein GM418_25550 [Maribellus comscasis]|uniref:Phage abortive infection protein n=1 Tax=Maribellus comscasis TaxID=2681766 RepID=A0A6I6JWA7_9BACT|nr:putative phage abortive infection protein [Maribellus comscasis]QGY46901.1 hypothetical protein GM418_25550 [Maribellus comscasis]